MIKNAVSNPDFEDTGKGLPGWIIGSHHPDEKSQFLAQGEPSAEISRTAHHGKRSLHVSWDIPDTDSWESLWTLTNNTLYTVKPGDIFTVSAWMKGTGGFRCGKVWMEVIGFYDNKPLKAGIGKDMMNATGYWMQFKAETVVPDSCNQIQIRFTGGHRTDLFLDDIRVYKGMPFPYQKLHKPPVAGSAKERVIEKLDRGVVALPAAGKEVYIGWRLLDSDPLNTGFNVYRISGESSPELLNKTPIVRTTDYTDKNPASNKDVSYFVRPVVEGNEMEPSEKVSVNMMTARDSCISIKLEGNYGAIKAGTGDLDGDGQYEYVIKVPKINFDPWMGDWRKGRGIWRPSPDTYKLEAYKQNGTLMWRYDMGWSIEVGVWFSPYVIYDLNGDGCAEVALKAGEGDPRQQDGRVWTGPEYLLILDGRTGNEIARTDWIPREGFDTHESLNRNQLCIAFLDGKTPCIIVERGTYDVIYLAAYTLENQTLRELWKWNDREEPDLAYNGQGAHCIHAVDLDEDGRDEVIIGAAAIDDNGNGLWSANKIIHPDAGWYGYTSGGGRGHANRCTVGDLDPLRPGLEIYYGLELAMKSGGITMVDAKTGDLLWKLQDPTNQLYYGFISDIDPDEPGVEFWGGDENQTDFWMFSARGKLLSRETNKNNLAAFWDEDLQREYFDNELRKMIRYKGNTECSGRLPSTPLLIADVLGDWREEIILTVPGELRIYTSTIPATDKRITLMRDPIYRLDVCEESQGYMSLPAFKKNPADN